MQGKEICMVLIESAVHWKTSTFLNKQTKLIRDGLRWVSEDGDRFYEWDSMHGEIEVYNKRGKHILVLNADGTISNKKAVSGRKINV